MGRKGRTRETIALWQSFGKWIKARREREGVKQIDLAESVGIHPVQLSRIENGVTGTRRGTLIKLAHALRLDMREAFNRAGYDLASLQQSPNIVQRKLLDYLNDLPFDQQQDLLAMAKLLWSRHGQPDDPVERGENVRSFNKL